MPLDSSIFLQGAALQNRNAENLQNQLSAGLKAYVDSKKKDGLDIEKLAEGAAYKKASGLPVTPEEEALARGWDKIQSTQLALDPLGRPYNKRQSIFDDLAPASQAPYQPVYSPVVSGGEAGSPFAPGFQNGSINDAGLNDLQGQTMTPDQLAQAIGDVGPNIPTDSPIGKQGLNVEALQPPASVAQSLGGRLDPNNPAVLEADIGVAKTIATDKAKIDAENAVAEKKKAEGRKQLEGVLNDMRSAIGDLSATGEVVTTGGDKIKNVENYLKNSALGQKVAGATGSAAQPPRDRFNSARNRLTTALMAATGMSSQQLNSNVELQEFLKSLGNTQMAPETVNSIIDNLSRQYGNGPQSPVYENGQANKPQSGVVDYKDYFK